MQEAETVETAPDAAASTVTSASADTGEPESTDVQQSQQEATDNAEDPPRDERGRFKGVQSRIDELTRKAREAERDAAYWRTLAEQKAQAKEAPQESPKPTPDKYSDYAEYVEALTEWKAEQKVAESLSKRDAEQARRAAESAAEARAKTFTERVNLVRASLPDWDEVVSSSTVPMPGAVRDAIVESDFGPQVAYHLAKNPEVAERIAQMSPLAAAREIGRIEAAFANPSAAARKSVTNAPPPTRPVSTGASRGTDLSKASMDEYIAARRAQGARY